jgi:4-amino-4-deoxychorismate lyase
MVLTSTTNHTYAHPFSTVTLAYFLRYCSPKLNPFAKHVLSTDTISTHVDPETGRLHTTRIHLKRSRLPGAVLKMLPTSVTGGAGDDKSTYILETSIVDMREGWMRTESRNLNFVGVLSVVEQQLYQAQADRADRSLPAQSAPPPISGSTQVATTVMFRSRIGERLRRTGQHYTSGYRRREEVGDSDEPEQRGWLRGIVGNWGTKSVQRTIETVASTKTMDQIGRSREGMLQVLERLRNNGLVSVLREIHRRDGAKGALDTA